MDKTTTIQEKRQELCKISKVAQEIRKNEGIDETINYILLNHVYDTNDANEFKTFEDWRNSGYQVRKGEKAFVVWGKPRKPKKDTTEDAPDDYRFYPITYLFSDKQVVKPSQVCEDVQKYGDFVGEIKVSYKRYRANIDRTIRSAKDISVFLREIWNDDINYRETVYIIAMNTQNKIIGYSDLFNGGTNSSLIDSKVIFQLLLNVNAHNFILAHNHPSGESSPSPQDADMTKRIKAASELLSIKLLDHIIITEESYFSFSDEGRLN